MQMRMQQTGWDDTPNEDCANTEGNCDRCGELIQRFRGQGGDLDCDCGAIYNLSGQRLRDDLYSRPVDLDGDDMEGNERSWLAQEAM